MKASFLKSKVTSLRKYDLVKAVIDILLPDLVGISDYNKAMLYRKGDKVYYYDEKMGRSMIIEAKKDIPANQPFNLNDWSAVGGSNLHNSEILKKLEVNSNNNLMYDGAVLNNVHVSKEEPTMNELDLWFGLEDTGEPVPPACRDENELVVQNMVVQDDQPEEDTYLWGDLDIKIDEEEIQ